MSYERVVNNSYEIFGGRDIFPTFASRFGGRETVERLVLKGCEIGNVSFGFWSASVGVALESLEKQKEKKF